MLNYYMDYFEAGQLGRNEMYTIVIRDTLLPAGCLTRQVRQKHDSISGKGNDLKCRELLKATA